MWMIYRVAFIVTTHSSLQTPPISAITKQCAEGELTKNLCNVLRRGRVQHRAPHPVSLRPRDRFHHRPLVGGASGANTPPMQIVMCAVQGIAAVLEWARACGGEGEVAQSREDLRKSLREGGDDGCTRVLTEGGGGRR